MRHSLYEKQSFKRLKNHIFNVEGGSMSVEMIRFQQLGYILEEDFDNNRYKLARKLKISVDSLNKYLSKGKRRAISDKMARQFEKLLGIKVGALDYNKDTNVYHVRVTFTGGNPREFLKKLRTYNIVKEASAQYGETDIFIKIEASEEAYQALILHHIRLFPGVAHTATSQALNTSRWQRHQAEYYVLPKEEKSLDELLDNYIEVRRKELYDELDTLDKGQKIVINHYDVNGLEYSTLLENAKSSIKMMLLYSELTEKWLEEEFFKLKNKPNAGMHYKILLFSDTKNSTRIKNVLYESIDVLRIGANTLVQSTDVRCWIGDRNHPTAIAMTIIDDAIVIIQKKDCFTLAYREDVVSQYSKLFTRNWNAAEKDGGPY